MSRDQAGRAAFRPGHAAAHVGSGSCLNNVGQRIFGPCSGEDASSG